jgi:hypothetical protein
MRIIPFFLGAILVYGSGALAADAWSEGPGASQGTAIYLDGPAALARLQAANPRHYARAQQIIAAANELCRPVAGKVQYARFDAKDISCARMLLRTSNPPKREISFRLDDTRYIALVAVTDDPARLVAAARR